MASKCVLRLLILLFAWCVSSIVSEAGYAEQSRYSSNWYGNRLWVGPEWWANPLLDWSVQGSSVISKALPRRSLCLLPFEINSRGKSFTMEMHVRLKGYKIIEALSPTVYAGFQFGRRGEIDDFRNSLVFNRQGIYAIVNSQGKLSLGAKTSGVAFDLKGGPIKLVLICEKVLENAFISLEGRQGNRRAEVHLSVPLREIRGGISLVSNGPSDSERKHQLQFQFSDFRLSGSLVTEFHDRNFGPILWSQYTLSHRTMRLQAQLAPFDMSQSVSLWVQRPDRQWNLLKLAQSDSLARTATFTIKNWNNHISQKYEVRMKWNRKNYVWGGTIRREPPPYRKLKVGCFSCDNGYLFPLPMMVKQVLKQNPDMVFFAGDQIYETHGDYGEARHEETSLAILDFLRKYYQFGWTWRMVLRDRPSVILPDDHDVYQENMWGHGGQALPRRMKMDFILGGYLMPGKWVAAVEKIHVGHLPDPAVDLVLPIGIKPYFTSLSYGGIGFAVLEDRKFKTGPASLPVHERTEGKNADLLGARQESFLQGWSKNWTGHKMKVALSQTIFCSAATHFGLDFEKNGHYLDTGAWPKRARNRVVRILGDANAFSIHGDQHLGILLLHGVKQYNDAGYAFMVPGTANGFPRAWWPGVGNGGNGHNGQKFTGKFRDHAGNPLHVLAVGNPELHSTRLPRIGNIVDTGYRKGSGYGIVEFDQRRKTATVNLYRLGDKAEQFPGFPRTVTVGGNPNKK